MQLFTRLDLDGITSSAMICEVERIDEINFTNPRTVEDREIDIDFGDMIVHLPFHPDARFWFHNHDTSKLNKSMLQNVRGKFGKAKSTARQVLEFYNPKLDSFADIIQEVDRIVTADLKEEDILNPKGWVLLSYTLDPRFIKEHDYGMLLLGNIRKHNAINDILKLSSVEARVGRYFKDEEKFMNIIPSVTSVNGKVIITDFRNQSNIPHGNRFSVFTKYPEGNVQILIQDMGTGRLKVSVGKSIINRSSKVNIGDLMSEIGGGGIEGAGTCILSKNTAETRLKQLIDKLNG